MAVGVIAWDESGSGPPAVLVHGLTEDRHSWDAVLPHLERSFRCVRLDLRGHGESSDADDYTAIGMAADVAEVVRAAGITEPPVLIGHSLGAVVVTAYAASGATVRAVVNVDQSLRFGEFGEALQPLATMLRGPQFREALQLVFAALGLDSLPPDVEAAIEAKHSAARPEVVLGVWGEVLDADPAQLTALAHAVLGDVRAPYLAIHGGDPGPDYATWLAAALPGAEVEVWDKGGHYPHLADPARFATRVEAFVRRPAG